ncbi:cobalt ECF transporter T component CbiQ [Magnetococcales bacterium HHB-1]
MISPSLARTEELPPKLQQLDPRMRIFVVIGVAITAVSMDAIPRLVLLLALVLTLAWTFRIRWKPTLKRLAAMDTFMVVLLVMLPFTIPGDPFLALGSFDASWQGLWRAVAIILKANCVVLTVLALLGTLESVVIGQALASLGISKKLVHMFLLTVRYIDVLHGEYRRLRRAMQARGFQAQGNLHTWRSLGWLMGMLLVRSFERSERILIAMKSRGFSGQLFLHYQFRFTLWDGGFALMAIILLLGIRFGSL